mgnify:CR=1 FL=1
MRRIKIMKKEKSIFDLSYDNLAIPEVHTHKIHEKKKKETSHDKNTIDYENVAIPEIHIKKKS